MYSLAIILSFLSVWSIFSKTKKVEFIKKNFTLYLYNNKVIADLLALSSLLIATILLSINLGIVAGIFTEITIWMLLASGVLLFTPFQKITAKHLFLFCLLIISIESLFYFLDHASQ